MAYLGVDVDILLGELRSSAASVAAGLAQNAAATGSKPTTDFATLLSDAVSSVSAAQNGVSSLQDRLGTDPAVGLQDVVLELSKASLSFQMMVQVRDRLVSAYRDVMNMQV